MCALVAESLVHENMTWDTVAGAVGLNLTVATHIFILECGPPTPTYWPGRFGVGECVIEIYPMLGMAEPTADGLHYARFLHIFHSFSLSLRPNSMTTFKLCSLIRSKVSFRATYVHIMV